MVIVLSLCRSNLCVDLRMLFILTAQLIDGESELEITVVFHRLQKKEAVFLMPSL